MNSPGMTRTCDLVVNSHPLYQLSYRGSDWALTPSARNTYYFPAASSRRAALDSRQAWG